MEHSIHFGASGCAGRAIGRDLIDRAADVLCSALMVALQVMLGVFLAAYPLLRLGYLGPAPEGHAFEAAFGIIAGAMALVLFVLEGRKE